MGYQFTTLPIELQMLIFQLCIDKSAMTLGYHVQYWPVYSSPVSYMTAAPMIFTRICRYWRALAINDSSLWTLIRVFVDEKESVIHPHPNLVSLFLERSVDRPVEIVFTQVGHALSTPCALPLFKRLLTHAPRWVTAQLHLSSFPEVGALLSSAEVNLLSLKYMVYSPLELSDPLPVTRTSMARSIAPSKDTQAGLFPNLLGFHFYGTETPTWVRSLNTQTLQQVHIQTSLSVADALSILSPCPFVSSVFLVVHASDDRIRDDVSHNLRLECLHSLSLKCNELANEGLSAVMNSILTPSLDSIDLNIENMSGITLSTSRCLVGDALVRLIERSGCQSSVRSLTLREGIFQNSDTEFMLLLQNVPELMDLTILIHSDTLRPYISDSTMDAMTQKPSTTPLCPWLCSIDLHGNPMHTTDGALGEMIISRSEQLLCVHVSTYEPLGAKDTAVLNQMQERGLDCEYRSA